MMNPMTQPLVAHRGAVVPPPELRARARRFVDEHGVATASKLLKCSRLMLTNTIANLPISQGSIALLEQRLPQ